jgi:hypothetical protein
MLCEGSSELPFSGSCVEHDHDSLRLKLFGFDAGAIEESHSCEGEYTFTDAEEEVTNSHDRDNRQELTDEAR